MKNPALIAISLLALVACTSIQVQPISSDLNPTMICIEENPKVIVNDFLPVIRNRMEFHGIETRVFDSPDPKVCEYILTYTAHKNWDFTTYLHLAELRLEHNGQKVGSAHYHLRLKGGMSLMKWQSTQTKMDPVVDELLGK